MSQVIKAAILGGIVLFVWSMVSWMALPWHMKTMHAFKDECAVSCVLKDNVDYKGVYCLPSHFEGKESGQLTAFVSVVPNPAPMNMKKMMVLAFGIQLIAAFLGAWLLSKTTGLGYLGRTAFAAVIGLLVGLEGHLSYWNWFGFSARYTAVMVADLLIAWTLAGAVMALVIKPNQE